MMKTLTRVLSTTPDPDELLAAAQAKRTAAAAALGEAVTALAAADAAYDAALGEGREAARAAHRHREEAAVDRDVASRALEKADAELVDARERAKAAKVQRAIAEAVAKTEALAQIAPRELRAMTAIARRLVRMTAEAQIAAKAAVRAGADPEEVPEVEAFRTVPGRPRKELSRTGEKHWINPLSGNPYPEDVRARIRDNGNGTARLYQENVATSSGSIELRERADFDRIVFLEAEPGPRLVSLVQALAVPGLMADDPAGWTAPASLDPHTVLARLDELENAPSPDRTDRRERKIELRRVRAEPAAPAPAPDTEDDEAA